jgi:hypothetical protein
VLDAIGWPSARRDIDTGSSSLDAASFDPNGSDKALAHLLDVVASENGLGFMAADGDARFIARHSLITTFTTVEAVFVDGRAAATGDYLTGIPYQDLSPEETDVVNDYTGKRTVEGAATLAVSDDDSKAAYGPRSSELTMLVDSDAEVTSALQWKLSNTKDPHDRIDSITVMPGSDLTRWATLAALEVGDRVTVVEQPPGFAAPVAADFLIRHIAVSLPTALQGSTFVFQLLPADAFSGWFVLDDAINGRLDFNKLAY